MLRAVHWLGSVAFLGVQLYELYRQYQAEQRAARDEETQRELLLLASERAAHLARVADSMERQEAAALSFLAGRGLSLPEEGTS